MLLLLRRSPVFATTYLMLGDEFGVHIGGQSVPVRWFRVVIPIMGAHELKWREQALFSPIQKRRYLEPRCEPSVREKR